MVSATPAITEAGKKLLLRAVTGEKITFTRYKIGNGELTDTDTGVMLDLINPLVEFPITNIDTSKEGYVKLTGTFDSTYITSDFRWRELGLFCKGEDDIEILYAYSNDGENAGMLKANATDIVAEESVALVIAIGNATSVTAILSESVLYAPKTEFDEHVASKENPHEVTAEQINLGNVPNVTTNDQTPTYKMELTEKELISGEKMSVAFGKIAKAIKSLISHLKNTNNPHNLSPNLIGAAEDEHEHSAADITSGILSQYRGGTGVNSYPSLRNAIGLGSNIGALEVPYGGTGLTSLTGSDYSTSRVRGISISSSVPTSIQNGHIVGVYSSY